MAIEEGASNLPTDIIQTVLSRLPVKSLLRFRTVSKSWNTMISDPRFVQIHLQQSKSSNSQNLFLRRYSDIKGFALVKLEGRKFQAETVLEAPYGWAAVVCSCDGVLLLSDFSDRTYVLWNPCSRTETMFSFPYCFDDYRISYGICHDLDFKVVIISLTYYAVFSCKNKSWTERKEFSYRGGIISDSGLSVNGAIYWIWTTYKCIKEIMYFDPRDEKFKMLQKPESVKDSDDFNLVCLSGCLCLYFQRGDEKMVQILVKEKGRDRNCWNELITIENVEKPIWSFKLLGSIENKILIELKGAKFWYIALVRRGSKKLKRTSLKELMRV
ncbi:hypothetical protein Pfo_016291 [Paulownia fortunei]|nr:hypothetical protein Pfo_016291 [Paulownia fortunei]